MNRTANASRLRREQIDEEKELWRALRAGRFAGFNFRRQHPLGAYHLDFYCPAAKLSVELDGFQHGVPEQRQHDVEREKFLATRGVEELRFWNHQWRKNRDGVPLEIWNALHRRTGWVAVMLRSGRTASSRRTLSGLFKATPLPGPLLHPKEERE